VGLGMFPDNPPSYFLHEFKSVKFGLNFQIRLFNVVSELF
jgi:hypothetical protein